MARSSALTEGEGWKTIRTETMRYVIEADGQESLFDLDADPDAYHNVANEAAYATALTQLRHHLLTRLLEQERPRPREWPY